MIVVDASAVVDLLLGRTGAGRVAARLAEDPSAHAPAVLDLEVAHALRTLCPSDAEGERRGRQAIGDLADLAIRRYPHTPLLERIWQLRSTLTAYDAAYVALAEVLGAPVVTRDARLARARGHRAKIELL